MNQLKSDQVNRRALEVFGIGAHLNQAIEECGEFIVAVNKLRRSRNPAELDHRKKELCGEIADVMNMMEQLALHYGPEIVKEIQDQKIARLDAIIANATADFPIDQAFFH